MKAESNAMEARRGLQELFEHDQPGFIRACAPVVRQNLHSAGGQILVTVLLANGQLSRLLLDGSLLTTEEAAGLLRLARRADPSYETATLRALQLSTATISDLFRFLDVLSQAHQSSGLGPILQQLARHDDPHVRSKAALLLGRWQQNFDAIKRQLEDSDQRVAANAIESLWGESSEMATEIFRMGLESSFNRVVGNSALGLYLAGDTDCFRAFSKLIGHSEDLFRASGLKMIEFSKDPRLLPLLADAMGKSAPQDRPRIFSAIRAIREARDKILAQPSLRVHMGVTRCSPDGQRRIRFHVVDGQASQILTGPQLIATNVVPFEDGQTILSYRCRPESRDSGVVLRLVAPQELESETQSIAQLRRAQDDWRTLPFNDERPLDRTLDLALQDLESRPGTRHLVVVGTAGRPTSVKPSLWLPRLEAAKIVAHTVLSSESPSADLLQTEALARETGGSARRYEDGASAIVEAIVAATVGHYELTYNHRPLEEFDLAEIKIQIFSPRGFGEANGLLRLSPA